MSKSKLVRVDITFSRNLDRLISNLNTDIPKYKSFYRQDTTKLLNEIINWDILEKSICIEKKKRGLVVKLKKPK